MKQPFPFFPRQKTGFTLVELLVAMSVLIAVTLMITSLVSNVSRTVELGGRSIDSDSIARSFFNRLSRDIENMIVSKDVNYSFLKQPDSENDVIGFLANLDTGGVDERPISVICYEFNSSEMQRAAVSAIDTTGGGFNWTAGIFQSTANLRADVDALAAGITLSSGDFQSFGSDIIRFEYSFLVADTNGDISAKAAAPTSLSDLKGLVVAIAVVDPKARTKFSQTTLDNLAKDLADSGDAADITTTWHANLQNVANGSGDKATAANNVRLYQRVFLFQQ